MTPAFRVLNQDGSEPDLAEITRTEEWAREWFWWTPHEFVVSADGRVFVVDEDLQYCAEAPNGRFVVRWGEETPTDE